MPAPARARTLEEAAAAVEALFGAEIDDLLFADLVDRAVCAALAAGETLPDF
jgi:hypothetical protein